jgi:ribosomal protein L11 methyltransferase
MKNPYEHLHIYNFDSIPELDSSVITHVNYLGTWEEDGTAFLFFSAPVNELISGLEARNPGISLVEHYEMSCEDWHGDRIEPYWVENLCIAPPWERADAAGLKITDKEVFLDPGVVFGTGRHQTTKTV